jgi:hypothetical protein
MRRLQRTIQLTSFRQVFPQRKLRAGKNCSCDPHEISSNLQVSSHITFFKAKSTNLNMSCSSQSQIHGMPGKTGYVIAGEVGYGK